MKIRIISLIILISLLSGCSYHAKYDEQPLFYSYVIGDVNAAKPSKEHNSKAFITPASCQKIITALIAYKNLGADYHYQTALYASKKHDDIQDLVLSFAGDPTLKSRDLITLFESLKNTKIKGKIIIDASKFEAPPLSNNIMKYDIGKDYAQPVSVMILDKNLINLTIKTNEMGKAAIVENDLGYQIDASNLMVDKANGNNKINFEVDGEIIKAYGKIAFKQRPLKTKFPPAAINDYI